MQRTIRVQTGKDIVTVAVVHISDMIGPDGKIVSHAETASGKSYSVVDRDSYGPIWQADD